MCARLHWMLFYDYVRMSKTRANEARAILRIRESLNLRNVSRFHQIDQTWPLRLKLDLRTQWAQHVLLKCRLRAGDQPFVVGLNYYESSLILSLIQHNPLAAYWIELLLLLLVEERWTFRFRYKSYTSWQAPSIVFWTRKSGDVSLILPMLHKQPRRICSILGSEEFNFFVRYHICIPRILVNIWVFKLTTKWESWW